MVDEVNSTSAEGSLERVTCIFPSVPDTSALVSLAFEDKLQKEEGDHCTNQCHIMEVEDDEDWLEWKEWVYRSLVLSLLLRARVRAISGSWSLRLHIPIYTYTHITIIVTIIVNT